jgi:tetratricopeptide (TPR) repeat protein
MLVNSDEEAREVEALINKGLAEPDSRIKSVEYQNPTVYRALLTAALGIVKSARGSRAEAEHLFWKACNIHPALPQIYDLLYAFYSKEPARQMDVLKRELKFLPADEGALKRMIFMLVKDRKYDEATPYIRRILQSNPNDVYANYQIGRIALTKGDCDQARVYLTKAAGTATSPDDVSATKDAMQQLRRQCGQ